MISLRVGLGIAAGALLFGAGWLSRGETTKILDRPITKIETKTDTQVQTQIVDHVVTKTQTVVKVVHDKATGDATTTTTVTQDKASTLEKKRDTESQSVATVATPSSLAKYSLQVNWQPRIDQTAYYPTGVEAGLRVYGPAWIEAGWDWRNHDATVGLRIEL